MARPAVSIWASLRLLGFQSGLSTPICPLWGEQGSKQGDGEMADSGSGFRDDSVPTRAELVETGPTSGDYPYMTGPSPAMPPNAQPAPMVPQPMRRAPLNYQPNEAGWWLAADGLWYPPETVPTAQQAPAPPPAITNPQQGSQNIVVHVAAPQMQPGYPAYVSGPPKSKVAAGLLGIFLGAFGAHRFYLGSSGLGVVMLLMTILSLGILAPITSLWGLIEGIVILCGGVKTDARGIPLK